MAEAPTGIDAITVKPVEKPKERPTRFVHKPDPNVAMEGKPGEAERIRADARAKEAAKRDLERLLEGDKNQKIIGKIDEAALIEPDKNSSGSDPIDKAEYSKFDANKLRKVIAENNSVFSRIKRFLGIGRKPEVDTEQELDTSKIAGKRFSFEEVTGRQRSEEDEDLEQAPDKKAA